MEKHKKNHVKQKKKVSIPTRNEEFKLSDKSFSVSDIQYYFDYIIKSIKHLLIILQ